MAKLIDKMFNRVIEGELSDLSEKDAQEIGKVVSGGTKLYRHTITTNGDLIIWVINNTLTQFTNMAALENYLQNRSNFISASFTHDEGNFIDIIAYNSAQDTFTGVDDMGTGLDTYSFAEFDIVQDTVTPL